MRSPASRFFLFLHRVVVRVDDLRVIHRRRREGDALADQDAFVFQPLLELLEVLAEMHHLVLERVPFLWRRHTILLVELAELERNLAVIGVRHVDGRILAVLVERAADVLAAALRRIAAAEHVVAHILHDLAERLLNVRLLGRVLRLPSNGTVSIAPASPLYAFQAR